MKQKFDFSGFKFSLIVNVKRFGLKIQLIYVDLDMLKQLSFYLQMALNGLFLPKKKMVATWSKLSKVDINENRLDIH